MPALPSGPGPQQALHEGQADPGPLDRGLPAARCVTGSDLPAPTPTPLPGLPANLPARQLTMPQTRPVTTSLEGQTPGPPSEPGHHIVRWGQAEYCTRCGRTTEAKLAGRAQQWRRLCQPLPSYISKLQKGHRLVYIGHWHCAQCSCPADRLYRTRCSVMLESPRPKPSALSDPMAPRTPQSMTTAVRAAHGAAALRQPGQSRMVRPPVQSQLERFFPNAKRPRHGIAEQ